MQGCNYRGFGQGGLSVHKKEQRDKQIGRYSRKPRLKVPPSQESQDGGTSSLDRALPSECFEIPTALCIGACYAKDCSICSVLVLYGYAHLTYKINVSEKVKRHLHNVLPYTDHIKFDNSSVLQISDERYLVCLLQMAK